MHTDIVGTQSDVSKQGHVLHSLLHMHTDLVCTQTCISKRGHTLQSSVHMPKLAFLSKNMHSRNESNYLNNLNNFIFGV